MDGHRKPHEQPSTTQRTFPTKGKTHPDSETTTSSPSTNSTPKEDNLKMTTIRFVTRDYLVKNNLSDSDSDELENENDEKENFIENDNSDDQIEEVNNDLDEKNGPSNDSSINDQNAQKSDANVTDQSSQKDSTAKESIPESSSERNSSEDNSNVPKQETGNDGNELSKPTYNRLIRQNSSRIFSYPAKNTGFNLKSYHYLLFLPVVTFISLFY